MGESGDYSDGDVTKMPELWCKKMKYCSLCNRSLTLTHTLFHDYRCAPVS